MLTGPLSAEFSGREADVKTDHFMCILFISYASASRSAAKISHKRSGFPAYTRESEVLSLAELEQRQIGHVERTREDASILTPTGVEVGPSCRPSTSSCRGLYVCSLAGGCQGRLGSQNARRGFEEDWEVSERYWLGCRPTFDVDGEDQLENARLHTRRS